MHSAQYDAYSMGGPQQEELLVEGHFAAQPRSAQHFADRLEASGASLETLLTRYNVSYSTLFFLAAWAVVIAGIIGFTQGVMHLGVVTIILSAFLLVFGVVMMVLDVPGAPRWAAQYRQLVFNQAKFLTRITGRAGWFLYLAILILVTLWPSPNYLAHGSGVSFIIGIVLAIFVGGVATVGLGVGIRKSLLLEKVRREMREAYHMNFSEVYRKYAISDPTHGLVFSEFIHLCANQSQGRIQWTKEDIAMIYNALDTTQKGGINEKEFCEWMAGPMTYL